MTMYETRLPIPWQIQPVMMLPLLFFSLAYPMSHPIREENKNISMMAIGESCNWEKNSTTCNMPKITAWIRLPLSNPNPLINLLPINPLKKISSVREVLTRAVIRSMKTALPPKGISLKIPVIEGGCMAACFKFSFINTTPRPTNKLTGKINTPKYTPFLPGWVNPIYLLKVTDLSFRNRKKM